MGVSLLALVLAIGAVPLGTARATAASTELFFSEYVEGTSFNKALEIYNGTGAPVDLLAGGYKVQFFLNGSSSAGRTIALTGTIANGDVFVLAQASASGAILAQADQKDTAINWYNGDDAISLLKGTAVIDSIGQRGSDPGSQWGTGDASTEDNTLRRKTTVTAGDTTPGDAFSPSAEWDGFATDNFDGIGYYPGTRPVVPAAGACGDEATSISTIQGTGTRSPVINQRKTVEAVVIGDYQGPGQFGGFHLQEEADQADGNPATSDGIFVFNGVEVSLGQTVRVTGWVGEGGSFTTSGTQITDADVTPCGPGASIAATDVNFPVASVGYLERYESMLVSIDQRLTITETFGLGRFGEVVLSEGGRLFTPTAVVEPGATAEALQAANDKRRIVLDDGNDQQNRDPILFPEPAGLSASNTLRVGDSVNGLNGVLEQRFGVYRIQPLGPIEWDHTNPRPAAPAEVGGKLRVAAMNVLNYFTTLDVGTTGCGPTGLLECRGAQTAEEFQRQRAKIVNALVALDADIVGLNEIQNDDDTALADLVSGLNDALGGRTYDYVRTGTIGTDAIKVALIYKREDVNLVGQHAILDSTVDPRFDDTRSRPALAQTFKTGSDRLTVVVNHLKSKGSPCAGDPDTKNGAGNCNVTRTNAAHALVDWLASDPTNSKDPDVLVIGDLNSYAKEDPIDVFAQAGYTDLIAQTAGAYSYVFRGQSGYLDYALASPSLLAQVTGAADWHINADEPPVLDYNMEFKSDSQDASLYAPDAYRSSDHDPLIVGLRLNDQNEEKN